MDMIFIAFYASGFPQKLRDSADETRPQAESWDASELHGARDLVRVAIALGAIAVYAGILILIAR